MLAIFLIHFPALNRDRLWRGLFLPTKESVVQLFATFRNAPPFPAIRALPVEMRLR